MELLQRPVPVPNAEDYIDGARLSRGASTPAATTTSIPRDDSNQIKYSITDANGHDADGALAANPKNGDLSLTRKRGELFIKVHVRWIVDTSGKVVGECFLLKSTSNTDRYLAVDTSSPNFTVKCMTKAEMGSMSNAHWRYIQFSKIGHTPPGSSYIALQYWGNYFGSPNTSPYYFVIEPESSTPFKIGPKECAAKHGRLGVIQY